MGAGGSEMGFLRGAWLHAIVMRRRGSALVVGPRPLRDAPVLRAVIPDPGAPLAPTRRGALLSVASPEDGRK
jgi:hypothetical protein